LELDMRDIGSYQLALLKPVTAGDLAACLSEDANACR
jgi:hypothetical protein